MDKMIMVINDTAEIQQLFEDILTDAGYRVRVKSYGTQDLEQVQEERPDLVVADCAPLAGEKQGWQFVQKMKMSRATEDIPIVICSTSLDLIHQIEGWLTQKGILALPKPFTRDELLRAVEAQLRRTTDATWDLSTDTPSDPLT